MMWYTVYETAAISRENYTFEGVDLYTSHANPILNLEDSFIVVMIWFLKNNDPLFFKLCSLIVLKMRWIHMILKLEKQKISFKAAIRFIEVRIFSRKESCAIHDHDYDHRKLPENTNGQAYAY